ncbi:MAG TPA: helix-turn-helix domain-containing protein, partial [Syntrophomonas sp.]|nr:helix-turn-helix domain-containing protein [Syntrophomonas sp.]
FLHRFFILLDEDHIDDAFYIDGLIDFCVDEMIQKVDDHSDAFPDLGIIQQSERRVILNLLKECKNNKSLVAKHMGIGRNTLYRKMKTLGIYDLSDS